MDAPATRTGGASATLGTDWEGPDRSGRSLRMMLSSAGRRVGLMRSFRDAAGALGIEGLGEVMRARFDAGFRSHVFDDSLQGHPPWHMHRHMRAGMLEA